jgi:hypothetical protein
MMSELTDKKDTFFINPPGDAGEALDSIILSLRGRTISIKAANIEHLLYGMEFRGKVQYDTGFADGKVTFKAEITALRAEVERLNAELARAKPVVWVRQTGKRVTTVYDKCDESGNRIAYCCLILDAWERIYRDLADVREWVPPVDEPLFPRTRLNNEGEPVDLHFKEPVEKPEPVEGVQGKTISELAAEALNRLAKQIKEYGAAGR